MSHNILVKHSRNKKNKERDRSLTSLTQEERILQDFLAAQWVQPLVGVSTRLATSPGLCTRTVCLQEIHTYCGITFGHFTEENLENFVASNVFVDFHVLLRYTPVKRFVVLVLWDVNVTFTLTVLRVYRYGWYFIIVILVQYEGGQRARLYIISWPSKTVTHTKGGVLDPKKCCLQWPGAGSVSCPDLSVLPYGLTVVTYRVGFFIHFPNVH